MFCCTIICFIRQVCLIRNLSTIDGYLVILSRTICTSCRCYSQWIISISCICAYCYSCYSRFFNLCFRNFHSQILAICISRYILTIAYNSQCIIFKIYYTRGCICITREFQINCISCCFSCVSYGFQLIFRSSSTSCSCAVPSCIGQARYMIVITVDSYTTDRCIFSSDFTSCAIKFNSFSCTSTDRYASQISKIFIQGIRKLTFILINCKVIPCN